MSDVTTPVRVLISGATGRMGQAVTALAGADPGIQVVGGLDRDGVEPPENAATKVSNLRSVGEILPDADVIIDFSAPPFLKELLEAVLDAERTGGPALVIGTTGLDSEVESLLTRTATIQPVLNAANFSVGVNILLALVQQTAAALGPDFDVEIVEAHHRRKEDAPSGTALALAQAVASGRAVDLADVRRDGRSGRVGPRVPGEIGLHAVRGGDLIGDHQVLFISDMERVELGHRAADRRLFAAGAIRAARWIAGRNPGRYTMRDVLGF
jgi:4-hydroxy-tetrahydrodipicolinate reductase